VRQVAGRYEHRFGNVPAYLLARLAAFAVDVPGVAFVVATFGFDGFDRGALLLAARDRTGFDTLALVALGAALLFSFLCEAIFGTTLGKLVFGLHTRRFDGRHAGVGRTFVRHLLRPLDVLVIGPFLALVTPRHQRAGDLAAGTVVGVSPLGFFAPLIGLALCGGLAYAQITFGGGLTSAIGVAAEIGNYGPDAYAQFASLFGAGASAAASAVGGSAKTLPVPESRATPQPAVAPTEAPAADATAEASAEPTTEATDGAGSGGDVEPSPQTSAPAEDDGRPEPG
jgi:uncharacterized RDD family membrane protein YckC